MPAGLPFFPDGAIGESKRNFEINFLYNQELRELGGFGYFHKNYSGFKPMQKCKIKRIWISPVPHIINEGAYIYVEIWKNNFGGDFDTPIFSLSNDFPPNKFVSNDEPNLPDDNKFLTTDKILYQFKWNGYPDGYWIFGIEFEGID